MYNLIMQVKVKVDQKVCIGSGSCIVIASNHFALNKKGKAEPKQSERDKLQGQNTSMWDKAIKDARHHIKRLQVAIKFFEESRDGGESWPGEEAAKARARTSTHF